MIAKRHLISILAVGGIAGWLLYFLRPAQESQMPLNDAAPNTTHVASTVIREAKDKESTERAEDEAAKTWKNIPAGSETWQQRLGPSLELSSDFMTFYELSPAQLKQMSDLISDTAKQLWEAEATRFSSGEQHGNPLIYIPPDPDGIRRKKEFQEKAAAIMSEEKARYMMADCQSIFDVSLGDFGCLSRIIQVRPSPPAADPGWQATVMAIDLHTPATFETLPDFDYLAEDRIQLRSMYTYQFRKVPHHLVHLIEDKPQSGR